MTEPYGSMGGVRKLKLGRSIFAISSQISKSCALNEAFLFPDDILLKPELDFEFATNSRPLKKNINLVEPHLYSCRN